jgi:hypothetical protein
VPACPAVGEPEIQGNHRMLPSDRVVRSRERDRLTPPFVGSMRRKGQVCSVSDVRKMRYRLEVHQARLGAAELGGGTND